MGHLLAKTAWQSSQPFGTIKLKVEVPKPGEFSKKLEIYPSQILVIHENLHLNQNILHPLPSPSLLAAFH